MGRADIGRMDLWTNSYLEKSLFIAITLILNPSSIEMSTLACLLSLNIAILCAT